MKIYIKNNERNTLTTTNENGSITIVPINSASEVYLNILKDIEDKKAEIIPYVASAPTWEQIRQQRNQLLTESDWITLTDATPKPNKEAWLTYRQALRDITKTYSKPEDVIWPTKPQ
jgi:hypothetical protein